MKYILLVALLILLCIFTYPTRQNKINISGYNHAVPINYQEGFMSDNMSDNSSDNMSDNTLKNANIRDAIPYHLLNDILEQPRLNESLSCVNSRSCYAVDFNRALEKNGSFRQITNNYKRNFPDSCSAPKQELVLNFYKNNPL
jgi:hypothetical protein